MARRVDEELKTTGRTVSEERPETKRRMTNRIVVTKDWTRDLILGAETSRAREEKSSGVDRPGEERRSRLESTNARTAG